MREKLARLLDGLTGTVQFGRDDPRQVISLYTESDKNIHFHTAQQPYP